MVLGGDMGIVDLNQQYYYKSYMEDVKKLRKEYSAKLQITTEGRTIDNRKILSFFVGSGSKHILLTAGVHGRESNNTVVLMYLLEKFLCNPKEEYTLCVMPLLNPDGYVIATEGFFAIENGNIQKQIENEETCWQEWKENARGIDINRNFPSLYWQRKELEKFPGSEEETRALMRVCNRYHFDLYLDFHSRGEEIYYYRQSMDDAYNERQRLLAEKMQQLSGYTLVLPEHELDVKTGGGNTVHYTSETFGIPSFTIETMPEYSGFPADISLQDGVYHQIKELPFVI